MPGVFTETAFSPAWYSSINVGEWGALPNSVLSTSGVQQDFAGGAGVFAFSGGIVNTTGVYVGANFIAGSFLILWGGGHNDYGGNEVYAYGPLRADSPQWYRLRDRTATFPNNVEEDGSGNPVSRHTYNTIQHVPLDGRNWLLSTGGLARYTDAGGSQLTNVFDFQQSAPNTNQPWSKKANVGVGAADTAAYDSTTGLVWSHPGNLNSVQSYDVAADSYSFANFKSPGWGVAGVSAIDTTRGIWAITWTTGLNFYRLNAGTANDYYIPTTTGTAPAGNRTVLYDPDADVFRVWNGGGRTLFTLTPPATNPYAGGNAWVWSSASAGAGATPDAQDANGTYGRFGLVRLSNNVRGYILLNAAASSIYFYRLV